MQNLLQVSFVPRRLRQKTGLTLLPFLFTGGLFVKADTLSGNLSSTSGGTEAATASTWLAAGFGTGSSSYTLSSVTLLIGNLTSSSVSAQLSIYGDDGLEEPGTFLGTLTASSAYSTNLASKTFTASGIVLSANSTYWAVLTTGSGELDWSYAANDVGTGTGFQDRWAASYDAGSTWYTYSSLQNTGVYPLQTDVEAAASAAAVPEPGTASLIFVSCGVAIGAVRRRSKIRR